MSQSEDSGSDSSEDECRICQAYISPDDLTEECVICEKHTCTTVLEPVPGGGYEATCFTTCDECGESTCFACILADRMHLCKSVDSKIAVGDKRESPATDPSPAQKRKRNPVDAFSWILLPLPGDRKFTLAEQFARAMGGTHIIYQDESVIMVKPFVHPDTKAAHVYATCWLDFSRVTCHVKLAIAADVNDGDDEDDHPGDALIPWESIVREMAARNATPSK